MEPRDLTLTTRKVHNSYYRFVNFKTVMNNQNKKP